MANKLIFLITFCVLLYRKVVPVHTADECQTHADCKQFNSTKFCCGASSQADGRSCNESCLNKYCSTDTDCGDPSMCCRTAYVGNVCVKDVCSGCTDFTDCLPGHYCCKTSLHLNHTVCDTNCLTYPCNSNNDCGRHECCRSGECVGSGGCSRKCTSKSECYSYQYCCKVHPWKSGNGCDASCVGRPCSSDDDCGAPNEACISDECWNTCKSNDDCGLLQCCQFGKCVDPTQADCYRKCTSNSECQLSQYCCRVDNHHDIWGDSCYDSCVGLQCSSNDDCGGPNECCISNQCVISGCSGCTTDSNCSTYHQCCKTGNELGECSMGCIGKPCRTTDDCGGPEEFCNSNNRCIYVEGPPVSTTSQSTKEPSNSLPSWPIAVKVVSTLLLLIAVGACVVWCLKRMRPLNATQVNRGFVPLEYDQEESLQNPHAQSTI